MMKKKLFVKENGKKKAISPGLCAGRTPNRRRNKRRGCAWTLCLCRTIWFAGGSHELGFRLAPFLTNRAQKKSITTFTFYKLCMSKPKINDRAGEILAKWYLRLNGYFTVDNFVVHAGDDPARISRDVIGNHTETDLLAVRHLFSREVSGKLEVQNDPVLMHPDKPLIDYVIAEVKTGNEDRPNSCWREKKLDVISYIVRFAGIVDTEEKIAVIANKLAEKGTYLDPSGHFAVRLIVISESPVNKHWQHLTNINFDHIIDFLVDVRMQCWINEEIGIRSIHYQWDPLMNQLFKIGNNEGDTNKMKADIKNYLQSITSEEAAKPLLAEYIKCFGL